MHLLADENVPVPVINRLRADGWSVSAMRDLGPGDDDGRGAARATAAGSILLTQDRDFGELVIARGIKIDGVVLMQLERLALQSQVERMAEVLMAEKDRLRGAFIAVEPTRTRRRAVD